MKISNLAVLATCVANLLVLSGCEEVRIPYGKLPSKAKAFIETFFPNESCIYAERERDDGRREYKVELSDGTEIGFYESGDWKSVDCKYSLLPAGIVPQAIVDDLAVRFPEARISKAARERGGYEIAIGNGLELIYSADGTFIREDRF